MSQGQYSRVKRQDGCLGMNGTGKARGWEGVMTWLSVSRSLQAGMRPGNGWNRRSKMLRETGIEVIHDVPMWSCSVQK